MKKIFVSAILGISLLTTMAMPALATTLFQTNHYTYNLPGSDNWNRGLTNPGTGYYMAYSYYYNSVYNHMSEAKIDGLGQISQLCGPGTTSLANSDSRPSYASANIRAAADNGSWHYVQDTGSGDVVVSGW